MAGIDMETVECGFCLRRDENMIDPVILPCSHTHCRDCLADLVEDTKVLTCPQCTKVFAEDVKSLPSSQNPVHLNWCDVCARKGSERQTATVYCVQCMQKYCDSHLASHGDFFLDHKTVPIEEYKLHTRKLQVRFCTTHSNSPYSVVCKTCRAIYCNECVYGLATDCTNGGKHDLVPIDKLSTSLKNNAHQMVARTIAKEETMVTFYKDTSKRLSAFNDATARGVGQLRATRDEQINAITNKYDVLEKDFHSKRGLVAKQLSEFLEDELTPAQTATRGSRLRIVAQLVNSHPIDLINEHDQVMSEMQDLVNKALPSLELDSVMEFEVTEPKRDIEMSLVRKKLVIDSQLAISLPKSLNLIKKIATTDYCRGISYYKGYIYASLIGKKIERIDENTSKQTTLIELRGEGNGVIAQDDKIYTLSPGEFSAYGLDGERKYRWAHGDRLSAPTKMAVFSNQVVIPERSDKQLAVCTFGGGVLKTIPCPFIGSGFVSTCAFAANSVIVSDANSNTVARINISTGQIIWASKIVKPEGVTSHADKYVLLASEGSGQISVLDGSTGELKAKLKHELISSGQHVFDLQVVDNILIVPAYGKTGPVLFYQLEE